MAYVNVALRKFCEDHNKTREMIKEFEEERKQSIETGENSPKRKAMMSDS